GVSTGARDCRAHCARWPGAEAAADRVVAPAVARVPRSLWRRRAAAAARQQRHSPPRAARRHRPAGGGLSTRRTPPPTRRLEKCDRELTTEEGTEQSAAVCRS